MTCLRNNFGFLAILAGAASAACSGAVAGVEPPVDAPATEEPEARDLQPTRDPRPAKLRVAHMWEHRDAIDVCVLGDGDPGIGVRPVYRAQGAVIDRVVGGIPQYKVGRYIRLEPGVRHLKIVTADVEDCSAPAIATHDLRLEEGTAFTYVLFGDDTTKPRTETFADKRAPSQKAESVRFYDFAIGGDGGERKTYFDETRLPDYRTKPEDVSLAPNQVGRFLHSIAEESVGANHETRELAIVSVFAAGAVKEHTFRLVVCDDDERAQGPLTDCR